MIKINTDILNQISSSMGKDTEYFSKILERLDDKIKDTILKILVISSSSFEMYIYFYHFLDTGTITIPEVETYYQEIQKHNLEVFIWLSSCAKKGYNRLHVLLALSRVFESVREVKELNE